MTGTEDHQTEMHLKAWGVPDLYARDYDLKLTWLDEPLLSAASRVSTWGNWFHEQDAALAAMVFEKDVDALRQWAESSELEEIALEDDGGSLDGEGWLDSLREAFDDLIAAMEGQP
jgi:hypothetical protein